MKTGQYLLAAIVAWWILAMPRNTPASPSSPYTPVLPSGGDGKSGTSDTGFIADPVPSGKPAHSGMSVHLLGPNWRDSWAKFVRIEAATRTGFFGLTEDEELIFQIANSFTPVERAYLNKKIAYYVWDGYRYVSQYVSLESILANALSCSERTKMHGILSGIKAC